MRVYKGDGVRFFWGSGVSREKVERLQAGFCGGGAVRE